MISTFRAGSTDVIDTISHETCVKWLALSESAFPAYLFFFPHPSVSFVLSLFLRRNDSELIKSRVLQTSTQKRLPFYMG